MLHVATRVTAAARRDSTREHSVDGRLDLCLRSAVVAICCAMLVASASAFAASQPGVAAYVLDKKGFWRLMVKDAIPEASRQLTPAEILLIHERLARISGLINQVKVLNPPMGMEVWPRALVVGPGKSPGPRPARSLLILAFRDYVLDFRNPSAAVLSEHSFAGIEVILNDIDYVLGRHPWAQDERGEMYLAPSPVGQVAGFPEYDTAGNGPIVLTRTTEPPWVPVSQERVIGSEIRVANADLVAAEQRQVKAEQEVAKGSPYQRWLQGREERLRATERVYQQLKQTDPKAAEEFRARMEKLEKDTGERLKANEAKTLTQQRQMLAKGRESLVPLKHRIQVLQDELASLAPAGRAAPASYLRGSKRPSGLVDAGTAGAHAVVAINPGFFSARLPKTSVQLIAISEYPTKSLSLQARRLRRCSLCRRCAGEARRDPENPRLEVNSENVGLVRVRAHEQREGPPPRHIC